jgi:hypothetical protein
MTGIIAGPPVASRLGEGADVMPLRGGYRIRVRATACLLNGEPLPSSLGAVASRASVGGAAVYLESEYFGGTGAEAAVGWFDGLGLGDRREWVGGAD